MTMNYKICARCVMDNTNDPNISFDDSGICNYCHDFDTTSKLTIYRTEDALNKDFSKILTFIKNLGKKKKYDCLIGLSGGVDSTYLALLAKRSNLRPLLVHFDNGWNSEVAVSNIEKVVKKTGFDLYTWVIDWELFRDIQKAYFRSSVVDIEVATDQFITAALYQICRKMNISVLLNGKNIATESTLPEYWVCYDKLDDRNLKDIHKKHGDLKGKHKYPKIGRFHRYFLECVYNINDIMILNYVKYNKNEVVKEIEEEFGWTNYEGKHYESIFTRFYQGYVLPKKFNIDKRKAHFSNLILSNQLSREEALVQLKKPTYAVSQQEEDFDYVCKKLGFSSTEFNEILSKPRVDHLKYKTSYSTLQNILYFCFRLFLASIFKPLRYFGILEKRLYL